MKDVPHSEKVTKIPLTYHVHHLYTIKFELQQINKIVINLYHTNLDKTKKLILAKGQLGAILKQV